MEAGPAPQLPSAEETQGDEVVDDTMTVPHVTPPPPQDSGEVDPDPPDPGDYETLFDMWTIQDIHLTVPESTIDALNADGGEYQPATFEHDGNTLDIGLRLKGSSTYQDFHGKPAFRVKFNEYVAHQKYATVKGLALNNLTGDPAQGREVISYWLWASGGMAVPRATLARVWVNDEYFGLYALIESMDDDFLARRYTDASGDLWAGNDEADLKADRLQNFSLQCGLGYGPISLEEAADALSRWDGDYYTVTSQVIDTDQFLDYMAYNIATGGEDGYPYHLNDFFVYADPGDGGRLHFSPWGQDESWSPTWVFGYGGGLLGRECSTDAGCQRMLAEHVTTALSVYESVDVAATAEQLFALSDQAMADDPREPYGASSVRASRAALVDWMRGWPGQVRAAMGL